MSPKSVFILSEFYYPDETATGYLLTKIAEGLAASYNVHVICGHENSVRNGSRLLSFEKRKDVSIHRCSGTRLNKGVLLFRLINVVTVGISIFFEALAKVKKDDQVLVVTNPPSLPFLAVLACKLKRSKCFLLIHDVYLDAMVAARIVGVDDWATHFLGWLDKLLYRNVDKIIVLGRDMKRLVERKLEGEHQSIEIITNWADIDEVWPAPKNENELLQRLGIKGKFIVQYAGNMGQSHRLEAITDAARLLTDMPDVHFLFLGSGLRKQWLEAEVLHQELTNVAVLPPLPRSQQQIFLNACDVAIISFIPGMAGVSVPSRMYNCMASGKPIIAIVDDESELAMVIREENIGWVVPTHQPAHVAEVIRQALENPGLVREMGERAREVAVTKYPFQAILGKYRDLLAGDGCCKGKT